MFKWIFPDCPHCGHNILEHKEEFSFMRHQSGCQHDDGEVLKDGNGFVRTFYRRKGACHCGYKPSEIRDMLRHNQVVTKGHFNE